MNKSIAIFSIFVSIMLVTQITYANPIDHSARNKAKEREVQFAKESKDVKIKELNDQKKALDPKPVTIKKKEPKGKAAAEATNSARTKALNDADTAYKNAKDALDAAKRALKLDSTNSTKQQNYDKAVKALEKARIDRELTKLN